MFGSARHNLILQVSSVEWYAIRPLSNVGLTLPRPLEEKSHNEYLQARHTNHQCAFNNRKIKYSTFCALHGAHVPILSCSEIFLVPVDGG